MVQICREIIWEIYRNFYTWILIPFYFFNYNLNIYTLNPYGFQIQKDFHGIKVSKNLSNLFRKQKSIVLPEIEFKTF